MTKDKKPAPLIVDPAEAQIKAVFDEGVATINGRDYKFTTTSHRQRVQVFAFYTGVQRQLATGDMGFLDSKEFEAVEKTIGNIVMFDDALLSRSPLHWEKYPSDYITFITMAMGVISYPFLRGGNTA